MSSHCPLVSAVSRAMPELAGPVHVARPRHEDLRDVLLASKDVTDVRQRREAKNRRRSENEVASRIPALAQARKRNGEVDPPRSPCRRRLYGSGRRCVRFRRSRVLWMSCRALRARIVKERRSEGRRLTSLATAAAKPAASRRAASEPTAVTQGETPGSGPGFRHFAIDRGVDFDLATAHETAPSARRNKLRREHERVRTELTSAGSSASRTVSPRNGFRFMSLQHRDGCPRTATVLHRVKAPDVRHTRANSRQR